MVDDVFSEVDVLLERLVFCEVIWLDELVDWLGELEVLEEDVHDKRLEKAQDFELELLKLVPEEGEDEVDEHEDKLDFKQESVLVELLEILVFSLVELELLNEVLDIEDFSEKDWLLQDDDSIEDVLEDDDDDKVDFDDIELEEDVEWLEKLDCVLEVDFERLDWILEEQEELELLLDIFLLVELVDEVEKHEVEI